MTTGTFDWIEYFEAIQHKEPSLLAFAIKRWNYNIPLLDRIRRTVPPPARVLEVGTGSGALAVLLAAHGYDVLGMDIDPRVIAWAKGFAEPFGLACQFEVGDGFDLTSYAGKFDVAFSAGVLEHFSPRDAVRMLQEQGQAARYVVAAVPTRFALRNDPFTEASGARPIRLPELRRLFARARLEDVRGFGYGTPDGTLSWIFRLLLPRSIQWILQNQLSYAGTIGCIGRARVSAGSSGPPDG